MNSKKFILGFLIIIIAIFGGCNKKKPVLEKPDNLINRITLVNILADSYLIESTLHVTETDSIPKEELARQYYKDLFEKYHITEEQFESSISYYVSEEKSAEKLLNDASAIIISKNSEFTLNNLESQSNTFPQ